MSADQPDDPTVIDRPPNAAKTTTNDSKGPLVTIEDAKTDTVCSSHTSAAAKQAVLREGRIVVLRSRIAALEETLAAERNRRRAIVNRYERILTTREQTEQDVDDDGSVIDWLRRAVWP